MFEGILVYSICVASDMDSSFIEYLVFSLIHVIQRSYVKHGVVSWIFQSLIEKKYQNLLDPKFSRDFSIKAMANREDYSSIDYTEANKRLMKIVHIAS